MSDPQTKVTREELHQMVLEGVEIHPIAEKHRQALEKAKVGELGFVSIRNRNLFPSELTVGMIPLYARALHAVICELEDRDFEFTPGGGEYDGLQITRDGDHASLRWSEAKLHVEREPTAEEKRRPSWTWQLSDTKPAGKLSIEVSALGLKGKRKWTEGEGRSLEEVIGIIIGKLEAVFCGFEARRKREAEWAKQRAEAAQREAAQRKQDAQTKQPEAQA